MTFDGAKDASLILDVLVTDFITPAGFCAIAGLQRGAVLSKQKTAARQILRERSGPKYQRERAG